MKRKLILGIVAFGLSVFDSAFASSIAFDNATPYTTLTWTTGSNMGVGFGPWTLSSTGNGGEYVGGTGDGPLNTFGIFGGTTGTATAIRPFTGGGLSAGQTFSVSVGTTSVNAGNVGLNLLSGSTSEFTFKFVSGATFWQLNDGSTDFNTTIPFSASTPIQFSLTYNGGSSYSVVIQEGSTVYNGPSFTAHDDISNLTGVQFFDVNQGNLQNFGFNNLSIAAAVPEPSTLALLVGPTILGAMVFLRRRYR